MRKNRIKVITIIMFLLIISGISVGYAYLETKLEVKGNATFKSSKWEIKFSNLKLSTISNGEASTLPEITDNNKIEDFFVKLTKPNDGVILTFDVQNIGTIDAYINSIIAGNITCASALDPPVESDAILVCDNIEYSLTYTNDTTEEQTQSIIVAGTKVEEGNKLLKNQTVNMTLKIVYKNISLPSGNVSINIGETSILYVQDK